MFTTNITNINGTVCTVMEVYNSDKGYKLFKLNPGKLVWLISEVDY